MREYWQGGDFNNLSVRYSSGKDQLREIIWSMSELETRTNIVDSALGQDDFRSIRGGGIKSIEIEANQLAGTPH